MGDIEKKSSKRTRTANIQKIVLQSIATAGVLSVGLLAPNVIGAMGKLGILPKPRQKEYISSSTSTLRKKGLLRFTGSHYELTALGTKVLDQWEFSNYKLERPKRWDGKWRVVIFDIPDNKKGVRDRVRIILRQSGFEKLQNSVWIFPYDCEDVIGLLKTDLGIGKNLLYMIVDELENDQYLRVMFDLK